MEKTKKGVRLEHISKIYQDPKTGKDFYAVKDTSLDIEPGSFVTLLGPSGCGKTTTLRMIAGFESPDEGEIYLGDEPINELTPNKRDTAMVFQSYALLPHYNVFDNVAYGLKLRKVPKDEIRERVARDADPGPGGAHRDGSAYDQPALRRPAAACCTGESAGDRAVGAALRRAAE